MKKLLGFIVAAALFFVIVGIIVGATTDSAAPGGSSSQINMSAYNNIDVGDYGQSYDDLIYKLGDPTSKIVSTTGDVEIVTATWNVNGSPGKMITVTFTNDIATSKAQIGLDQE